MTEEIGIQLARERADYEACVDLQRAVWGMADVEVTSVIQFVATVHAGGMVHLARTAAGRAVGFTYAFASLRDEPHLHSDLLAVLPEYQGQGVGARLKWAQRDEALARGVKRISWTFDPLQARNANLNLRRLGAVATAFHENFYGVTASFLHHGMPTDRLEVHWELGSETVRSLQQQGEPPRSAPAPDLPGANEVTWKAGWPVSSEPDQTLDVPALLLQIPPDWDVLCKAAPRVAQDWHAKVRSALRGYFDRGYRVTGFLPTEERGARRPLYVLRRGIG